MHDILIPQPVRLTYEDYCALPDDGKRWELLDGDLYMRPSPQTRHQRIAFRLATCLRAFVEEKKLGEVFIAPFDVVLNEDNVVQPDIIFVATEHLSIVTEKNIQGVPNLLIEVLSPSRIEYDCRDKRNVYARAGVPYYWIVDPNACTIVELKHIDGAYATVAEFHLIGHFASALLAGFTFELKSFWN